MKSLGIVSSASIMRPGKKILWVGAPSEAPPTELSPLLATIKFISHLELKKNAIKTNFSVFVFSCAVTEPLMADETINNIKAISSDEKLLVLSGLETDPISDSVQQLINHCEFDKVLFLPHQIEKLHIQLTEALGDTASKISRTKALVEFVKKLSGVSSVEDLLQLLKNEVKHFRKVKEPILAFARAQNELMLLYFQGKKIVEKVVPGVWPQQLRIRLNDVSDSQYLANIFGRPYGKLISIPLKLRRKNHDQLPVSAVLFFEHALPQESVKNFFDFIEERLLPMSIALDRLLLEQDLNEDSLLWERTFDGFQDPVAIFDSESQILRANKSFSENLVDVPLESLFGETLIHKGKFFEIRSYPIALGAEAQPTNIINHYVDRTFSQRLKKQMIQNEKMAALGHMAGHIAHELNNPLTGIRSLAQVLVSQTQAGSTLNTDLSEVEKATERCQIIIRNLLEFSSGDLENQKVPVSMNDIVMRTLPLLKTLISHFEMKLNLTDNDCQVFVEPQLMQQVVFNIIKNAAQAMGDEGSIGITTVVNGQSDNPQVELRINDTGGGIDPTIQDQIFDFFFTTKSQGQGTGLGLSMSKSIVDRFNGKVEVKNRPGIGSEFIITLPVAESVETAK